MPETTPTAQQRLFNRDLSWLSFNYRVLLEAADPSLPLYERIKFLAIYSSNNGEFFQVRVASIQSLVKAKKKNPDEFSSDPEKLLEEIFQEVHRQQEVFGDIFRGKILPELADHGIHLIVGQPTAPEHQAFVQAYFEEEVQPFLHPELLRKGKILHFLRDNALYHAVKLCNRPRNYEGLLPAEKKVLASKKRIRYALIQIPTHYFSRFVKLPSLNGQHYYMFLDDVIRCNLNNIFPGYEVQNCHSLKLNRNAEITLEDEFSGDLVEKMKRSLKKRRIGVPARFLYDRSMPVSMLNYLRDTFDLRKRELLPGGQYHSYSHFFTFPNPLSPALERDLTPPLPHHALAEYSNLFDAIRTRNWLLHFPYHSYDYVIRFLNQAATDPKVTAIYATQYRVASNSAIVNALIRAAQNGKRVTVFVELKARFDEAANVQSAEDMRQAGVETMYSLPGLKVHSKVALVIREEEMGPRGYAFLSTGNFNEKTARIYTDEGYFTANRTIIAELQELFAHLSNQEHEPKPFQELLVGHFGMRTRFLGLIDREIAHAQAGRQAGLFIKVNNLEDVQVIDKLYEASQAGVPIRMIVRGICRLRPGVPGLSDHIEVIRLVDQFLEHARAFLFANDGHEELYQGSADWMTRNLSRRIEVIFPIKDPQLIAEVKAIMEIQWADNVKAVRLNDRLENIRINNDRPPLRAQLAIYHHIKQGTLLDWQG
jgi:polyphosphate kinase